MNLFYGEAINTDEAVLNDPLFNDLIESAVAKSLDHNKIKAYREQAKKQICTIDLNQFSREVFKKNPADLSESEKTTLIREAQSKRKRIEIEVESGQKDLEVLEHIKQKKIQQFYKKGKSTFQYALERLDNIDRALVFTRCTLYLKHFSSVTEREISHFSELLLNAFESESKIELISPMCLRRYFDQQGVPIVLNSFEDITYIDEVGKEVQMTQEHFEERISHYTKQGRDLLELGAPISLNVVIMDGEMNRDEYLDKHYDLQPYIESLRNFFQSKETQVNIFQFNGLIENYQEVETIAKQTAHNFRNENGLTNNQLQRIFEQAYERILSRPDRVRYHNREYYFNKLMLDAAESIMLAQLAASSNNCVLSVPSNYNLEIQASRQSVPSLIVLR